MSKQFRKIKETYEVCDWCEKEIDPIYDDRLSSLWPLFNIKVKTAGILSRAKWLLANWSMESGRESYMLHALCAHKMISWAIEQKKLGGPERLQEWGAYHKDQL